MDKVKKIIYFAGAVAALISILFAGNTFATAKEYTIQTEFKLDSSDNVSLTFELQNIDGTVVSSKTSGPGLVSFDPITLDDADTTSHYYKIVQKNDGISGVTYDSKTVYVRIVPSSNLIAYQDDTTYKYKNDGTGPHPYHATDEELQGQAYAVYDSEMKILTFFRDEENKYTDGQTDGVKTYYTGFEFQNAGRVNKYDAEWASWMNGLTKNAKKVVFRDAIRPEGPTKNWFEQFEELEEVDFSKFDTSRITSLYSFLSHTPKLQDADISHFDLSGIASVIADAESDLGSGALASFMSHSQIKEFDSTNYAVLTTNGGRSRINDHMLAVSGLRFLDATNFDFDSGSGEFSSTNCLERVIVGPNYNFLRSNLGTDWLKIETGEINVFDTFMTRDETGRTDYIEPNPLAVGNYVRPTCETTPASFKVKYTKPATPSDDDVKNPETNDDLAAVNLAIISIAGIFVVMITGKTKH